MSAITVNYRDSVTPRLQSLFDGLGSDRRAELHESMGLPVEELTRHHLDGLAATRHNTANRLGATPSGFFAQASEKVNLAATGSGATVSIDHPGMGRAAHDVDIDAAASGKKALTIPLIAPAYNQRAYAIWDQFDLFVVRTKEGKAFIAQKDGKDGGLIFWYALVPHVHQAQDRTLLPSDDEIAQAAREGALAYVDHLLSESEGGAQP